MLTVSQIMNKEILLQIHKLVRYYLFLLLFLLSLFNSCEKIYSYIQDTNSYQLNNKM